MSENGLHKIPVLTKALGSIASLHAAVESGEVDYVCRICAGIPYPCVTRRVADEALSAIERKVKP